jgi:KUP system potassium uptake protein
VRDLGMGFYQVLARYGFMQTPYVPEIMERSEPYGLCTDPADTSYFLGRETLLTARGSAAGATSLAGIGPSGMSFWRKALFAFLSRNAPPITTYFGLPVNRVVEMGTQVEL